MIQSRHNLQEISRNMKPWPPSLFLILFVTLYCFDVLSFGLQESRKLYIVYLGEKRHEDPNLVTASHHDMLTSVLGSKEDALSSIIYSYRHGFSGFAAMLTESQAQRMSELPEVIDIALSRKVRLHTTRSWDFLGLNYNQHEGLLRKANYGEGIIIGVVDSGIWPESRSFQDTGYGPIPSRWRGICQVGQEFNTSHCNRKLIGARFYTDGATEEELKADYVSPRDSNNHGTHTASTAAGNLVENISSHGIAGGMARGGAPRARVAVYKVGWGEDGGGGEAAMVKAIDHAIHDGVDVLSLSLGWGGLLPYATLHAVAKGINVVFAGGNDGPPSQTITEDSPWVITVAATTIDRSYPTVVTLGNNQKLVGQSIYYGLEHENNFIDLVGGDRCDTELLNRTDVVGKIILCSPDIDGVSESMPKVDIFNVMEIVQAVGAKGFIYVHYSDDIVIATLNCQQLKMICVLMDFQAKFQILRYLRTTSNPMVKVAPTQNVVGSEVLAPKVAAFSSRGPSPLFPGLIKPDIAAPGVSILAAMRDSYRFDSGTSMACPHISGISALLKALHPDWSPAAIKSALVTTASITDAYGDPIEAEGNTRKTADPFDFGGGNVDPERAADPGLIYDINPKDYFKFFNCNVSPLALCEETENPLHYLNLPSVSIPDLTSTRTVWRTVTNLGNVNAMYKAVVEAPAGVKMIVEPSVLRFNASHKMQTFKITFMAARKVQGDFKFGSLTWVEDHGTGTHSVRIPIAARIVIQYFYSDIE